MGKSVAHPFVKWAGGKRKSVERIVELIPDRFGTYYEPFVGGGAVFFELARLGRFRKAVLGDTNTELMTTYRVIRDCPERLISHLYGHKTLHSENYFYTVRDVSPAALTETELAARFVYLNRTCFNGLYRVNRKGHFNVPFGRYENPKIFDEENIRDVSAALQNVELVTTPFEKTVSRARSGSVVYFDPPYLPAKSDSFTSYQTDQFGLPEHEQLAELFAKLADRGVRVLLSNSNTQATRRLYKGWRRRILKVGRAINSKADGRGKVTELLFRGARL